ncbi:MAG: ferrochelatase [Candidatus Omnitrophica bacterium]|nr:ferrochelatase [Candidatus Omnitrophota bacterium]
MKYDHVLLVGHGGPRQRDEVMPFLEAITAAKQVSELRLAQIVGHYESIGGSSPYHAQVLGFADKLEQMLREHGIGLPVFTGMKYWHPFLKDVLEDIQAKGRKRGLAIPLTAYRSAAAGAGYQENLESLKSSLRLAGLEHRFIDGWSSHTLYIEAQADEISHTLAEIGEDGRKVTTILFSFHSLPVKRNSSNSRCPYLDEACAAGTKIAERLNHARFQIVFQSIPEAAEGEWLGPDIADIVRRLAHYGEKRMLIAPVGFFCDHVEILYDLDDRLRQTAEELKIGYFRAGTVIHNPKLIDLFEELIRSALI